MPLYDGQYDWEDRRRERERRINTQAKNKAREEEDRKRKEREAWNRLCGTAGFLGKQV